ncbi:helix-turn-helix transcriptional regulator [Candidatus Saccharibacteria bacterium]|nr:helix-turn-helix transcriptional regulator [Candidatus Saccharibacteria bacterium]
MSESKKFEDFGVQLRKIRLDANKTIDDVSGAVELPTAKLELIEMGRVRPKEELIYLLANYFNLSFSKVQHLLRLAGYKKRKAGNAKSEFQSLFSNLPGSKNYDSQQLFVAISDLSEEKTVYTNETSVNVSKSGVVIEFLQSAAINRDNQPRTIAKVGMSIEHAYQLRDILQHALSNLMNKDDSDQAG